MSRLSQQIATRLRAARRASGLTQEEVARRAGDGITAQYVSRLERGVSDAPRRTELGLVTAVFGLTVDDVMGLESEPAPSGDDDDTVTLAELERRIRKATGNRDVAIGLARVATRWDRLSKSDQRLIEAAVEVALKGAADDPDPPTESPE